MHVAVVHLVFNHCMKIPQLISSTILRHLSHFCGLAVTNSTTVSILYMPLGAYTCPRISLEQRVGVELLVMGCSFHFNRECRAIFQSAHTKLYPILRC